MNGEKTVMKDDHEFDSWRTSSQSHYTHSSAAQTSDPYGMSYYPTPTPMFPYSDSIHNQTSQPWSNGAETMTFLGGYQPSDQQQHSGHAYTMEAMFGSQNTYPFSNMASNMASTPFNAFFPSNSDPFWGSQTNKQNRSAGLSAPPAQQSYQRIHDSDAGVYNYGGHHATDSYVSADVKQMESGIAGLTLDHIKASADHFSAKSGLSFASEPKKGFSDSAVGSAPKKTTWASIASQPAKPAPKSLKSKMSSSVLTGSTSKHLPPTSMEAIGTWEGKNGANAATKTPPAAPPNQPLAPPPPPNTSQTRSALNVGQQPSSLTRESSQWTPQQTSQRPVVASARRQPPPEQSGASTPADVPLPAHPVLDKLRVENNYNPKEFDLNPRNARFFIIKSYSEDDIHRSIKYSIWCSTEHGNKRLDHAFKQHDTKGPIYLLFSVNGSGHFCGMAQMMSSVDYSASSSVWAQDKWKGQFRVQWIYVKDVPNAQLRHIRLENNENKPVTNSRDTQEVPFEKGKQVIKIMHHFRHSTSIFDDFLHYEKRQEESQRPDGSAGPSGPPPPSAHRERGEGRRQQQKW